MSDDKGRLVSRQGVRGSVALGIAAALPANAVASEALAATIHAGNTGTRLSPMLYGGFIEHIGGLINQSLWSELLDDRKFYYGVVETLEPPPTDDFRAAARYARKWTAVGPFSAISLDKTAPFVGEHRPVVQLAAEEARGVAQSNLNLVRGKSYSGRIMWAADVDAELSATLIWGPRARDRQTIRASGARDWSKARWSLRPGLHHDRAS